MVEFFLFILIVTFILQQKRNTIEEGDDVLL